MMPEQREGAGAASALIESLDCCIPVGRVTRPHGIKGEIKVQPYSGDPAALCGYPAVILMDPESRPAGPRRVAGARTQGKVAILSLENITSRGQAEAMAGWEVWAEKIHLPPLAEEEFYWQELEGRRVVTTDGRDLGRVSGLLATGAHDILVVTGRGREYLIPAIREFMVESGEKTGVIVIQPVPGLLEIND